MNDRSVIKLHWFIAIFWILSINFFRLNKLNKKSEIKLNLLKIPGTNPVSDIAAQHGFHKLIGQDLTGLGHCAPVSKAL